MEQASQLDESQVTLSDSIQKSTQSNTIIRCPSCDYTSTNKHYFKQHTDLVHTNERPFKCPFCNYAGKRSHALKEHLVVHSTERPHQCSQCNATFRKKGHLTNHSRMHTHLSEMRSESECTLCDFVAPTSKEDLYKHQRSIHASHKGVDLFFCAHCPFVTAIKTNLVVHEAEHNDYKNVVLIQPKLPRDTKIILKCSDCGYETAEKRDFEAHVLKKHSLHPQQVIENVDRAQAATPSNTLNSKAENSTSSRRRTNEVSINKCPHCGYICDTYPELLDHIVSHKDKPNNKDGSSTSKIDKCHQCGYTTSNYKDLILHIVSHRTKRTETAKWRDADERKAAKSKVSSPSSEQQSYTFSDNMYVCNFCGYECDLQRTIKAHMWKHSGHRNLEYPTFQNGPLSVYDGTIFSAHNFMNMDRASLRAIFKMQSTEFPNDVNRKIGSQNSNGLKLRQLVSDRTGPKSPPKVIVQRIETMAETPSCSRSSSCVVDSVMTTMAGSMTAQKASNLDSTVTTPADSAEENPLEVMTAVCETVNKQATDSIIPATPHSTPDQPNQVWSDTEQSAATLLSMLRQGPNFNPACVPEDKAEPPAKRANLELGAEETVISEQTELVSPDSPDSPQMSADINFSNTKPKSGICSSLLAVIEQLRERQVKEEVVSDGGTSPKSRKKKRRRSLVDVELAIDVDMYPNVEELTSGSSSAMTYRCKLCHYSSNGSLMKQHLKKHRNKKPYECSLCSFIATSNSCLQDHMILHCKSRQYQCKRCSAVFNYKSQLRAHSRVHEDGQAYYCVPCDYVTSSLLAFKEHITEHPGDVDTHSYGCIACRQDFSDLHDLQSHMKNQCAEVKKLHTENVTTAVAEVSTGPRQATEDGDDTDKKTVKCDQCDFVALSVRSLKSHSKRHINDKKYIQQPLEQYKCNMCGYVCHHLPSLKSHMWKHAGEANFSYSFSDVLSEGKTPMDKQGKPLITLRCCQCGFETLSKKDLDSHMKSHWDIIKKTFDVWKQGEAPL